jgi:hypothetical protein
LKDFRDLLTVPEPAAVQLIDADAEALYLETCERENLPPEWSAAPDWCRGVFLEVARAPYKFAVIGLNMRRGAG